MSTMKTANKWVWKITTVVDPISGRDFHPTEIYIQADELEQVVIDVQRDALEAAAKEADQQEYGVDAADAIRNMKPEAK